MPDAILAGLPIAFPFEGKTYQIAPRTLAVEAAFAKHHADQAYLDLQVFAATLGPEGFAEQKAGWRQDLFSRAFSYGSPLSRRYLGSEPGFRQMAFLLLSLGADKCGGDKITMATVDRILRDPVKGPELLELVWGIADPNRVGPLEIPEAPSSIRTS